MSYCMYVIVYTDNIYCHGYRAVHPKYPKCLSQLTPNLGQSWIMVIPTTNSHPIEFPHGKTPCDVNLRDLTMSARRWTRWVWIVYTSKPWKEGFRNTYFMRQNSLYVLAHTWTKFGGTFPLQPLTRLIFTHDFLATTWFGCRVWYGEKKNIHTHLDIHPATQLQWTALLPLVIWTPSFVDGSFEPRFCSHHSWNWWSPKNGSCRQLVIIKNP